MQLFECPRIPGKLTLSEASCANQHKAAQSKDWAYRLPHCVECQIGAKNAGLEVGPPFAKRAICVRCGSTEGRMVLGRYCMSCYNREREWRIGKNAKGRPPKEYRALKQFALISPGFCRRFVVDATCVVEARLVVQKFWGFGGNLVLDRRDERPVRQLSIFDLFKDAYANIPRCHS